VALRRRLKAIVSLDAVAVPITHYSLFAQTITEQGKSTRASALHQQRLTQ